MSKKIVGRRNVTAGTINACLGCLTLSAASAPYNVKRCRRKRKNLLYLLGGERRDLERIVLHHARREVTKKRITRKKGTRR